MAFGSSKIDLKLPTVRGPIDISTEQDKYYFMDGKVNQEPLSILNYGRERQYKKREKDQWMNLL